MTREDTEKMLGECNSGIKMGVDAIDGVLPYVKNDQLRTMLDRCKDMHQFLGSETHELLNELDVSGKSPSPVARGMSWIKTNVSLAVNGSDATIADLMTDGCNMGVKSLSKYLNEYKDADERAKSIAARLIDLESGLSHCLRSYL